MSSKGIAGNHGFAPYEQITRGSREPTVDVYCLAATLYYAVTGQNPTTSLARRLEDVPLTPPKQIISGISDQLNQAIIKRMALEAKDRPQSMEVWLAMLEAPKAKLPPPIDQVHRTEVVRSKANLNSEAIPGKAAAKSLKIIPWRWLVGVLFSYLYIGCISAAIGYIPAANYPYTNWAAVCAGTVAWAGAVAWGGAWGGAGGLATVEAGAVAKVVAKVVALGLFWAVVVVKAGYKLRESFSKFHTFLILASTSSLGLGLGLGLGWLGHRIFNTVHSLLKL